MNTKIRVLLVNQIRLLGSVLASVLGDESDMQVIGCATKLAEALDLAPKSDVILLNTRMPDGATFELIRSIANSEIEAKVLVLGMTDSKEQVLPYIQAGAAGYVLKDATVGDLLERIRGAHTGHMPISPKIASALIARLAEYAQLLGQLEGSLGSNDDLTAREKEILDLIGLGLTNQQIAERLMIGEGTVKNHVHKILQKLNASNRHDAAAIWEIVSEGESVGFVRQRQKLF